MKISEELYREYLQMERETSIVELDMQMAIGEYQKEYGREQAVDKMIGDFSERAERVRRKRMEVWAEIRFVLQLPPDGHYTINEKREAVEIPGQDDWMPVSVAKVGAVG